MKSNLFVSEYGADRERVLLFGLLLATTCYLCVLSFLNARGLRVSSALVGLTEALLYFLCIALQFRRLPFGTVVFSICVFSWLVFTWLVRDELDPKGLRDIIIPLLFISLGRYVNAPPLADIFLRRITIVLVVIGLFEVFFTDAYARLFNTFSFYVNLGGIRESSAMFEGQMLTLNGYRPEGIGRTILPFLFGSHRASSTLMEPVSFGNFAVILLAWGLSKSWKDIAQTPFFIVAAVLIISLADSRFGILMGFVLLLARCVPYKILSRLAPLIPVAAFFLVLGIAYFLPNKGDNILGRVTRSGMELLKFDWTLVLGLHGPLPNFGDMGYAYVLSRFGAPLVLVFLFSLFLIPMKDEQGIRFRALILFYFSANLAISGTSIFALKTAGICWFLFGVLALADKKSSSKTVPTQYPAHNTPMRFS